MSERVWGSESLSDWKCLRVCEFEGLNRFECPNMPEYLKVSKDLKWSEYVSEYLNIFLYILWGLKWKYELAFFLLETIRRCGFFLKVFSLSLPDFLECDLFPENSDPDVCVGYNEVREAARRAEKPGESNTFFVYCKIVNFPLRSFACSLRTQNGSTNTYFFITYFTGGW